MEIVFDEFVSLFTSVNCGFFHVFPPDGVLSPPRIVPLGLWGAVQMRCLCSVIHASSVLQNQRGSKEAQKIFHSQIRFPNYFSN